MSSVPPSPGDPNAAAGATTDQTTVEEDSTLGTRADEGSGVQQRYVATRDSSVDDPVDLPSEVPPNAGDDAAVAIEMAETRRAQDIEEEQNKAKARQKMMESLVSDDLQESEEERRLLDEQQDLTDQQTANERREFAERPSYIVPAVELMERETPKPKPKERDPLNFAEPDPFSDLHDDDDGMELQPVSPKKDPKSAPTPTPTAVEDPKNREALAAIMQPESGFEAAPKRDIVAAKSQSTGNLSTGGNPKPKGEDSIFKFAKRMSVQVELFGTEGHRWTKDIMQLGEGNQLTANVDKITDVLEKNGLAIDSMQVNKNKNQLEVVLKGDDGKPGQKITVKPSGDITMDLQKLMNDPKGMEIMTGVLKSMVDLGMTNLNIKGLSAPEKQFVGTATAIVNIDLANRPGATTKPTPKAKAGEQRAPLASGPGKLRLSEGVELNQRNQALVDKHQAQSQPKPKPEASQPAPQAEASASASRSPSPG